MMMMEDLGTSLPNPLLQRIHLCPNVACAIAYGLSGAIGHYLTEA